MMKLGINSTPYIQFLRHMKKTVNLHNTYYLSVKREKLEVEVTLEIQRGRMSHH